MASLDSDLVTAPLRLVVRRQETWLPTQRRVVIGLRIPTALDVVEEAVDLIARHCVASGVPPRAARFTVRVALCEALANAILYGNKMDPSKRVEVSVEVDDRQVKVQVSDEGDGFDPTAVPDPTALERRECEDGRGLFLIRQLADEVYHNDRGNSICMIMHRA